MEAVAGDLMAAPGDLAHEVGLALSHLSQNEERRGDAVAVEGSRIAWVGFLKPSAGHAFPTRGLRVRPARARRSGRPTCVVPVVEVDREDDPCSAIASEDEHRERVLALLLLEAEAGSLCGQHEVLRAVEMHRGALEREHDPTKRHPVEDARRGQPRASRASRAQPSR